MCLFLWFSSPTRTNASTNKLNTNSYFITIIIIIIIGSTALGGPWPPLANLASDLYPARTPAKFYSPVSFRLHLPRQSILISVGHVLVDVKGLSVISF